MCSESSERGGYLSFSSFLSGVWSTVSLSTLPLRDSMARLSPTLATTSSIPSLSSATVHVVPALIPAPTETWRGTSQKKTAGICQQKGWPMVQMNRTGHLTLSRVTTWTLKVAEGLEGRRRGHKRKGGLAGNYRRTTDEAVTHAGSTQTQRQNWKWDLWIICSCLNFTGISTYNTKSNVLTSFLKRH